MKYYAIPLREDGSERLGTLGIMYGEYKSVANFMRYNFNKNRKIDLGYNIYSRWEVNGQWNFLFARSPIENRSA